MNVGYKCLPLVSVVVPFYRHKEWLREALDSVFYQDYENLEIILVNDGSTEDVTSILEEYSDKLKYIYQENKGAAAARNRGILEARGKYIAFIDSDDIWERDKISSQIEYMNEKDYRWCHTDCVTFSEKKAIVNYISGKKLQGDIYPIPAISSYIATPAVIVEKNVLINNNLLFYEDVGVGEDTMLWLALSKKYPIGCVQRPLTKVRLHGNNAIANVVKQIEFRHYLFEHLAGSMLINDLGFLAQIGYKFSEKAYRLQRKNMMTAKISFFIARVLWNIEVLV